MRPQQRPTAVTVLAILNFVIGGLLIVLSVCGGLGLVMTKSLTSLSQSIPTKPGEPNPFQEMGGMYDKIPGFYPYSIADTVIRLILGILLIVAGVGLLNLRSWGRTLSLAYAVVTILWTILGTAYTILLVNPAVQAWAQEFTAKMAQQPGAPTMPAMGTGTSAVMSILGGLLMCAYPIVLLAFLNQRRIKAAFRGGPGGDDDRRGGDDDYDPDEPLGPDDRTEVLGERRRRDRDEGLDR